MSLRQKAISGVKWTSLSSVIIAIVQILKISILARYLSPSDFGLMAMVTVVIGFSQMFADLGISNAIIYKQETSHSQLSSLYWLNIFSGLILFLIVAVISPLVAKFYNEPKLIELLIILSFNFIIIAIGNQYRILFQKELKFNFIAKIEIAAAVGAFVIAVVSAMEGLGIYALVYAALANVIISSGLFFLYGLRIHKPSLVYKYQEIKGYIGFGMYQMGGNAINYLSLQFDTILIGKLLGTDALGIYSVIKQLIMRPAQIINPILNKVTFPVMAKVQEDMGQLKNIYLKTIRYLSSINFPISMAMVILAEPIVMILFGEKWRTGIPILQILSVYAMIRSTVNPIGSLFLATGRVDLGLWWNASMFIFVPIVIYIGSAFGLNGIAFSQLIFQVSLIIPVWYFLVKKMCAAGFVEYMKQISVPFVLALPSAIVASIGMAITENYILQILFVSSIGFTVYLLLNIYFNKNFIIMLKAFR